MKALICIVLFLVTGLTAYSQNPLIESVARAEAYEMEGIVYLNDFSAKTSGCSLEYFYEGNMYDPVSGIMYEFSHTSTIPFKSITKIDQLSDGLEVYSENIKTVVGGDDDGFADEYMKESITIYLSSPEDSKAAAVWMQEQVSACGGRAEVGGE